jgi:hypothetical protein
MECRFGVEVGAEGDVESGLSQRQAEESAFAGLSLIMRMEWCVTIYREDIGGERAGLEAEARDGLIAIINS